MAHGTCPWYNCAMKKLTVFILTICVVFTAAAANAALKSFNKALLAEHIRSCVARDIKEDKEGAVDELIQTLNKIMK